MKKLILLGLGLSTLCANNTFIYNHGIKSYENSKFKQDGKSNTVVFKQINQSNQFTILAVKDKVNLKNHPLSKTLEVEKYGGNFLQKFDAYDLRGSYLKIIDNLAPTDQGKVYGIGIDRKEKNNILIGIDYYKSDYKKFDVNQYSVKFNKGFMIEDNKYKFLLTFSSIEIDGDKYGTYTFKDKKYFTSDIQLKNQNKYFNGFIGMNKGKKMFGVSNDGLQVQHHAMEFDKVYYLGMNKKIKDFTFGLVYNYSMGSELPENTTNVKTRNTMMSIGLSF